MQETESILVYANTAVSADRAEARNALLTLQFKSGALVLLLADIAARTLVAPQELATGAMTALVGAPVFIFIAARFFK